MSGTVGRFYEIPTQPAPRRITVTLGSAEYQMTFRWMNAADAGWIIDIADTSGNMIVAGVPLVTGADLLAQYKYLGMDIGLLVMTDGDPQAPPTFTNLGSDSHLYFCVYQ